MKQMLHFPAEYGISLNQNICYESIIAADHLEFGGVVFFKADTGIIHLRDDLRPGTDSRIYALFFASDSFNIKWFADFV
jgi:hypothetical protein